MDVANISLGGPVLIGAIWAVVQLVKKRVPNFSTDWCWVLACGLGVTFAMIGAVSNPTPVGLQTALEQGLLLGVAAVGLHNTGVRVPPVLADIIQYLNLKNFGTPLDVSKAAGLPPDPPLSEGTTAAVTPDPVSAVPPLSTSTLGGPSHVA